MAGPVSVWATTDEGLLHLYTLVSPGHENLRAVFGVERELLGQVDPLGVDFDVFERPEILDQMFNQKPPLFQRT